MVRGSNPCTLPDNNGFVSYVIIRYTAVSKTRLADSPLWFQCSSEDARLSLILERTFVQDQVVVKTLGKLYGCLLASTGSSSWPQDLLAQL